MTTPHTDDAVEPSATAGLAGDDSLGQPHALPHQLPIPPKTKDHSIHVSPAVLDAARKDGEELLRSLGTSPQGLTQTEAEERVRTTGPNEVAQERRQGWPIRLLKILRNPLVVLLAILSSISYATGDARADDDGVEVVMRNHGCESY